MPASTRFPSRAFSIIELVIVIAIIGGVAAITVPRFSASLAESRADAAARQTAALLHVAQSHARASSASVRITFDPAGDKIRVCLLDPATASPTTLTADDLKVATNTAGAGVTRPRLTSSSGATSRRAAMLSLKTALSPMMTCSVTSTEVVALLPHQSRVSSANIGGSNVVTFNGHGLPSAGGKVFIAAGAASRAVNLDAATGHASVER